MTRTKFFAMNRKNNTAAIVYGVQSWEEVQWAFRAGIIMPDGTSADAIGRCRSLRDFQRRAQKGNTTILNGRADCTGDALTPQELDGVKTFLKVYA